MPSIFKGQTKVALRREPCVRKRYKEYLRKIFHTHEPIEYQNSLEVVVGGKKFSPYNGASLDNDGIFIKPQHLWKDETQEHDEYVKNVIDVFFDLHDYLDTAYFEMLVKTENFEKGRRVLGAIKNGV